MKPIQLHPKQIEALANGATALLFVSKHSQEAIATFIDNDYIECYSPLQVGNEYYVQEEFAIDEEWGRILYRTSSSGEEMFYSFQHRLTWQPASEMTYESNTNCFYVVIKQKG